MIPIGNWLRIALMQAPAERPSGLLLLERPKAQDGIVLVVPDGRTLNNGDTYPIGINAGDRVMASKHHFREWEDGEAFLRVEEVVATLPGPHWRKIEAFGPYVLVVPELIKREEERESGVVISHVRLRGGHSRELERGERLLQEFKDRGTRLQTLVQHPEERIDILGKWYKDLPGCDREALKEALEKDGDTGYKYMRPPSSATDPRRGMVVSVGPGRVREDGTRQHPLGISCGQRVHWDRGTHCVELYDGRRILFAIEWRQLCAVETEDVDCKG